MSEPTQARVYELKQQGVLCPHCELFPLTGLMDKCNSEFCGDAYSNYLNAKEDARVEAEVLNKNNDGLPKYPEGWEPIPTMRGCWYCDPELNTKCKKNECRALGKGDCYSTTDLKFAKRQPVMACRIRTDNTEDELQGILEKTADGELMYEEGETVIVPKEEYRELVRNAHFVDCLVELGFKDTELITKAYEMADKRMEAL